MAIGLNSQFNRHYRQNVLQASVNAFILIKKSRGAGKPTARMICEGEAEWPSYSTANHCPAAAGTVTAAAARALAKTRTDMHGAGFAGQQAIRQGPACPDGVLFMR